MCPTSGVPTHCFGADRQVLLIPESDLERLLPDVRAKAQVCVARTERRCNMQHATRSIVRVVVQAAFAQRLARHARRLARCAADPKWAEQLGGLPAALRNREQAGLGSRMRIVSRQAFTATALRVHG